MAYLVKITWTDNDDLEHHTKAILSFSPEDDFTQELAEAHSEAVNIDLNEVVDEQVIELTPESTPFDNLSLVAIP